MTLTLPPELERHVSELLRRGGYPSAEDVLLDAVKALVRERERQRIEALLTEQGIDDQRIERLLQEAEDSGDYTEMTGQDWLDIERDAVALMNSRKSG